MFQYFVSAYQSHMCDVCGKSFALKHSLKAHWLTHVKVSGDFGYSGSIDGENVI